MTIRLLIRLAIGTVLGLLPAVTRADILSSKRGFADNSANYNDLQASGAGWYYDWGATPRNTGNFDAKFYPMFWNAPSQTTINNVKALNPQYVLGFNEPERSDQANMSVSQAISSWTQISNSFAGTSTMLVSPAVADTAGSTGGQQWLASFMSQAKAANLKIDAVAFHWYDISSPTDPVGAANQFLGRIDSYHNSYGLPVFVTEFAIHDWGGTYPVSQMIAANQQFLSIVIPGLESRSYVAGYSWYNWFHDSALYTGIPMTPTPMGYSYIGAVGSGTTVDMSGVTYGEHVAYLTGGTLTLTSGTSSLKYLNALANTSTITGTIDWGLNSSSTMNWVRVQPGATLLKNGSDTITLGGGTVANNGVIQVAQGALRIAGNTSGYGSIDLSSDGGATGSTARLELTGNVNIANAITFAQRNDPGGSDGIRNVSGNNTLGGPMTITLGGNQARVQSDSGQLTLSGTITTDATTARNLYLQGAAAGVASGAISNNANNAGGIINVWKQGAGAWTLSGANTYTGTTNVNAGTLGFSSSPSNIGSVTVANSAGLRIQPTGAAQPTLTSPSITLGSGGTTSLTFDFNGLDTSAPLISTGVLTANGTVNVAVQNGGALLTGTHPLAAYTSLTGGGTFSGSPFTLGPRTTGTLVNNGTNALNLIVTGDRPIWTGADNGNWVVGATGANKNWKLQTATTATDYIDGDNVLFDDTVTGSTTITVNSGNVAPAATTFSNSTKSYTVSSSAGFGISGSGPLIKSGSSAVTLSTVNSYTGGTTVNGGTLNLGVGGGTGAIRGTLTINSGATVNLTAVDALGYNAGVAVTQINIVGGTLNDAINGNNSYAASWSLTGGTMSSTGGGALHIDAGSGNSITANASPTSSVISANVAIRGANSILPIIVADGAATTDLLISGALLNSPSESGANGILKSGAGNLVLSGANTYTGPTTINAGTISIGADNNLGANGSPVTLGGGTLKTTAFVNDTHPFTIASAGGTIDVTTTGQYYFNVYNLLQGSGPLAVTGTGTLTMNTGNLRLGQGNTYSGALTVKQGGILEYGVNGAVDQAATLTIANQGEVAVQGGSATSLPNGISVTGATNSVLSFENGDLGVVSGPIALSSGANLSVGLRDWYNYANARSGTISGVISGSGGLTVNSGPSGGGTLTLSGLSTFTGNVVVNGGTLAAANDVNVAGRTSGAFGNPSIAGRTVTINSGATIAMTVGNVLGTGSQTATPALSFIVNQGGLLKTAAADVGAGGGGDANIFGNVTLNGGTLTAGNGANVAYQSVILLGAVTTGGTTPSAINTNATNTTANGVQLAAAGTTFNVGSTGGLGPDLVVSAPLANAGGGAAGSLIKTGAGTMQLTGNNSYSGSTTIKAGTLQVNADAALGAVPASPSTNVTFSGTGTLKAGGAVSLAVNRNVSIAAGVIGSFDTSGNAMTIAGKVADSGTLTKTGAGTLEVDGAPSFASGSSLQASNGTLRWNLNSGLPSIGSGVTATVGSGATMELAGITSALGAAGGNRVSTTNNSTAPGILVTGSHQVVGGIDGSGTTQINAGSDLTADHVVQSALVIGGTSGSAGVFTIDASGPTGNPLVGGSTGSLTGNDQTFLAGAAVDENLFAADLAAPSDTGAAADSEATNSAAVPEPSTLVLACVALMGAGCSLRRSSRRMSAE